MSHTPATDGFTLIKNDEKCEFYSETIKLTERKDDRYKYELFQMGGLYLEVRWCLITGTKKGVRVFDDPDILEPYFNEMNLSDFQE